MSGSSHYSRKDREAASSDQQPVYAQVRKPPSVTSQQEDPSTGVVRRDAKDAGSVAFRPSVAKDTLNYTEVVFTPTEEVSR